MNWRDSIWVQTSVHAVGVPDAVNAELSSPMKENTFIPTPGSYVVPSIQSRAYQTVHYLVTIPAQLNHSYRSIILNYYNCLTETMTSNQNDLAKEMQKRAEKMKELRKAVDSFKVSAFVLLSADR